ncbi:hypothetical protein AX17_000294 [Amanita inopinata Kibby_2008]|nr:hypothetical protein AX17_000294 [Amanita inopinata Kibby_2008]
MQTDVARVRAEIKQWEKNFKSANGRAPTIDDIKAQPDIADKYRLYKRLSKAAAAAPPSTPPRVPALLPSATRLPQTTAPLATFNPFSPTKNKKQETALVFPNPIPNPFTTPCKSASQRPSYLSSPQSPTSCQDLPPFPASSPTLAPAVSRARKRLRGEPVSPSPNKEKRQRITSHHKLPIPFNIHSPNGDQPTTSANAYRPESLFVDNSPVKQPVGNKSFTVLFEETLPPPMFEPSKDFKTDVLPGVKGAQGKLSANPEVDLMPRFDEELGRLGADSTAQHSASTSLATKARRGEQSIPATAKNRELYKPTKRSLTEMELDSTNTLINEPMPSSRFPALLPPSPPPEASYSAPSTSKGRAKSRSLPGIMTNVRKKTKLDDANFSEEEESSDCHKPRVKVVDRPATAKCQGIMHHGDDWDDGLESDPDAVLAYVHRPRAQGLPRGIRSLHNHPSSQPTDAELRGKLEVDLPNKLRDVLALDNKDVQTRDKQEERMVERLLYNRRTMPYDPDKGGEIWDVGEDAVLTRIGWDGKEEVQRDTEGDDDWEGEPVSWEIAEL